MSSEAQTTEISELEPNSPESTDGIRPGLFAAARQEAAEFRDLVAEQITDDEKLLRFVVLARYALNVVDVAIEKKQAKISNVVDHLTPWEMYLSMWEKDYRETNLGIDIGENKMLDPESMAHVALVWLSKNEKEFQNQPLRVVINEKTSTVDPRVPADHFRAAIRQEDGTYTIMQLNEDDYSYDYVEEGVKHPDSVQVVVDNRSVPNSYGNSINHQSRSAFVGIGSNVEGIMTVNVDHLAIDGIAITDLTRTVARYAKTSEKEAPNTEFDLIDRYEPTLDIEKYAPSLNKLGNRQVMAVYARAMLASGFDPESTIQIPSMGLFHEGDLDSFYENTDDPEIAKKGRIQPVVVTLNLLAQRTEDDEEIFKKVLGRVREDVNQAALTHFFRKINNPNVPNVLQKLLVRGVKNLPVTGELTELLNGSGLVSMPVTLNDREYTAELGEPVRDISENTLVASTVKSPYRSISLVKVGSSTEGDRFCVSGSEGIMAADLRKFALKLEQEAQNILNPDNIEK